MDSSIDLSQTFLYRSVMYLKQNLFLFFSVFIVLQILRRRYLSPLGSIPGPFIASCTRWWNGKPLRNPLYSITP
jgi:hypothetical protein